MNGEKDNNGQPFENQGQSHLSNNLAYSQYSLPIAIERITEALFMVTGLFEEDYLRDKIRQNAIEALSLSHELITIPLSLRGDVVFNIEYLIKENESLIRISKSNNFISEMNADILLQEYKKTREKISHRNFIFSTDSTRLEENFFLSKEADINSLNGNISSDDSNFFSYKKDGKTTPFIRDSIKDNKTGSTNVPYLNKKIKSDFGTKRHSGLAVKNNGKNDRRDLILKIINKSKNSTIKDISTMISGCSEKTIQRELSALVGEKVLKKTGEKRWTRYFLA